MRKKVLSPLELIELRTRQIEEKKILAAKLEEENKLNKKIKKILSPSDLLDPELELEEKIIEIAQKPKDPFEVLKERIEQVSATINNSKSYDEEILSVNTEIEQIKENITKSPEVKYYDKEINYILEKLNSLDIRYYEKDILEINERLNNLKELEFDNKDIKLSIEKLSEEVKNLYEVEILDPKETHEYINSIKDFFYCEVKDLKQKFSKLPEVRYYENDLTELREKIESVRNSIPEIPEIKYYDEELKSLVESIENVRANIPEVPEVRYYENEIFELEKLINEIEDKVSKLPEVRYYDSQINELNEIIKNVENKIPTIPEVRYYDGQIEQLEETIKNVEDKIPTVPEFPKVKYYDKEILELNSVLEKVKNDIYRVQKSVDEIVIPDQIDWSDKIKSICEDIERLKEVPIITESTDPLVPLDQNFATLDDLQNHYKIFINRIQQQLSSLGGGGETRLEFLDDLDRNSAKVNGKFLKYDSSIGKWVGADGGGGGSGSQDLDTTLGLGNTSNLGMSVGVITATSFYGDGSNLTGISSFSGDYNDLINTPTSLSDFTNDVGFITSYVETSTLDNVLSRGNISFRNISVGIVTSTGGYYSGNLSVLGSATISTLGDVNEIVIVGSGKTLTSSPTLKAFDTILSSKTSISEDSIDSFAANTYRSGSYDIQVTRGNLYHTTTLKLVHDGTNVYLTEYGTLKTGESLASFNADIVGGNVLILATPTSSSTTVFKGTRNLIKV